MRGGRRPQVQFKDLEVDYKDLDSLRQFVGETGKSCLAASPVHRRAFSVTLPSK